MSRKPSFERLALSSRPTRWCSLRTGGSFAARVAVIACLASSLACATGEDFEDLAVPAGGTDDRIPVESFFTPGPLEDPKLSPQGGFIAGFRELDGNRNLVKLDLATGRYSPVTAFPDERLVEFWWVTETRLLVSIFREIDRSRRLYAIDSDGKDLLDFAERRNQRDPLPITAVPADQARAPSVAARGSRDFGAGRREDLILTRFVDNVVSLEPSEPDTVLLQYFYRTGPAEFASRVYRVNVETGRTVSAHQSGEDPYEWIADPDGRVRLAAGTDDDETFFLYRPEEKAEWTRVECTEPAGSDRPCFEPLGTSSDPFKVYVRSQHEDGRYKLYLYDLETRTFSRPLFEHPWADVGRNLVYAGPDSADPRRVIGIDYTDDFHRIHWLTPEWQEIDAKLRQALPGLEPRVVSRSRDDSKLLVYARSDRDSGSYLLFEPAANRLSLIAKHRPELDPAELVSVDTVSYTTRDGREIQGYLALPKNRGDGAVPVIINPHGGIWDRFPTYRPTEVRAFWSRSTREWSGELQLLASRGFAVFRPNFRGSTGLGAELESAGFGQWGGAMQQDLVDGTRWLIEQGIADPQRICIYGAGYGGYASMLALAQTPELFACGAAVSGIYDLDDLLDEQEFEEGERPFRVRIGDRTRDRERLRATSPIALVDRMRAPMLIVHGTEDQSAPDRQARSFAAALERAGKPHDLLLFRDEPHGFTSSAQRIRFYRNLEAFLYRHLGRARRADAKAGAAE